MKKLSIFYPLLLLPLFGFSQEKVSTEQELPRQWTWKQVLPSVGSRTSDLISTEQYLFAAAMGGQIYRSDNAGQSWDTLRADAPFPIITDLHAFGEQQVIASTLNGLFLSKDEGTTWTDISSGLPRTFVLSTTALDNKIFAGTDNGIFLLADDKWSALPLPRKDNREIPIFCLFAQDSVVLAGSKQRMYYSLDSGKSWLASPKLTDFTIIDITKLGTTYFVATTGNGLFEFEAHNFDQYTISKQFIGQVSDRGGILLKLYPDLSHDRLLKGANNDGFLTEVESQNEGLKDLEIHAIAQHQDYYFVGTQQAGVYRLELKPFEPLALVTDDVAHISQLELFPNPVVSKVNYRFRINESSSVIATVLDAAGKTILNLPTQTLEAGSHMNDFTVDHLPSGQYFLHLQSDKEQHTLSFLIAR